MLAQTPSPKKIDYTSDRSYKDEEKYPGAFILSKIEKQVYFNHEGIEVWCDQAIFYQEEDFFKAYGNVKMKQGDTINMTSNYAEYNGNTKFAFASTDVKLKTPSTTLTTDSLFFNRKKQQAFYRSGGKVEDTSSTITSIVGRYFMKQKKYSFVNDVVVTNPDYIINSQQIDYYSETRNAYLYGPSTITNENSKIYCERGYYDMENDKGYFVQNSQVFYENRKLEGDSIFFNKKKNFASATNNIKVTDTANQSVIKGHYAEIFKEKDSLFITKRAIASMKQETDSIHIHSDTLMITGKPENRIIRGFYHTKMYKSDMNGKCDSIHINEKKGLTQMIGKPVVWSGSNQMTGDSIHLINNRKTEKMDSLKVFYNAFMIQKDSIEGYNQVKGKEMYGLFRDDNQLSEVNFIKNTETIFYSRDEKQNLIGISKAISSSIKILFEDQTVSSIYYNTNPENILYQENDFPKNARKLRGFNWRGDEQIKSKEDLFSDDEPLNLPKIKGISLPEEEEHFFEERDKDDDELLNQNSRLKPETLQHRETDTTTKDSISKHKELINIPLKEKQKEKK
ncbi:OstA-like protein [Mesonia aestuariivivens]|uniref:LPS export ABC transporter periplasmic protein LptC n=1 Tax=Mesonia aestuariivivens TaxID=2796128 RepID=A0ABS6W0F1_9FLAO|nr:OstA-like protein [Mesonia aestuariivivens]MBW2961234.1 LPS export ABC transporter periplasmic protein LptC [Mesonia aestuariivivens]